MRERVGMAPAMAMAMGFGLWAVGDGCAGALRPSSSAHCPARIKLLTARKPFLPCSAPIPTRLVSELASL